MRKLNLVLLILLLLMVVFVIYFQWGSNLHTRATVDYQPADAQPDLIRSMQRNAAAGALPQQFAELPADIAGCTLVTIDVVLTNAGMIDAEWLDISVSPAAGDIAVYQLSGEGATIRARSSGQVSLQLLTTRPAERRSVRLNYYVYGIEKTITVGL
ncbi:MAG: hypothetical protein E7317_06820 [Clostridiales bacterium]|nr:hypothetical protein [Clostridiales bacterium]